MTRWLLTGATLLCLQGLAGCATHSESSQVSSSVRQRPAPIIDMSGRSKSQPPYSRPDSVTSPPPAGTVPAQPVNPAVNNLLQQAAQARTAGDYSRAQALAERAQAMAPREAGTYLELARLYSAQGDQPRARQMALRGLSVVSNDPATRYELQLLSQP